MRDLGTHLSLGQRAVGTTLTRRLEAAADCAIAIARLPADQQHKMRLVKGKAIPMGIYGAAAAPCPKKQLAHFRSVISRVGDKEAAVN
eukprot:9786421-Alexandrium_andersonii.AAC.1